MSPFIKINPYVQNLSVSPTLKINQKMQILRGKGLPISHFGFGQSPFPAPDLLEQALQECATQNAYLPTQGLPQLREAIASWMGRVFQIETSADQIFVGPGSKECLFDLMYLLDGTVMIPQASWVSYKPIATLLNKPHQYLNTTFENGYCLQPDTLEKACQAIDGQKLLILNSPNNPTGQIYGKDLLEALAQVCKRHDVIVISDEIYGLVQFDAKPYSSIQHFYPEKTIVTNGLSKAFSAGGFRLGFACLPESFSEMFGYYNTLISETYSAVASPIQYAATSVFNQYEKIEPYILKCNSIHKWVLETAFNSLLEAGFRVNQPQGGFYLLADLNERRELLKARGIHNGSALCDYILDNYGVGLLPGKEFGLGEEFLGFRLAPVDYDGKEMIRLYPTEKDNSEFGNYFPKVKRGLDQLNNFVHSLNQ